MLIPLSPNAPSKSLAVGRWWWFFGESSPHIEKNRTPPCSWPGSVSTRRTCIC